MKAMTRQEQAKESRQKLMDSALHLFAHQGYAGTSVHTICAGIGAADGLLYHYFPGGKGELMQEIVRQNMSRLVDELDSQNSQVENLPLEELLEELYLRIEATVLRHDDLIRLFIKEQETLKLLPFDEIVRLFAKRWQWFPGLLRARAEKGEIRPMDFESAAETLDSLMLYQLALKLAGLSFGPLADAEHRKRMIAYQLSLWRP